MRVSVVILLLLLPQALGICQSASQENVERLVRAALDQKSPPDYDGFSEGPLNRSGDGAAVAITKALGGKDLNANDISRVLLIIHRAFAAPKIIEIESDRQPRTTLFVLKYLSSLPVSPKLREEIAETKKFVEQSSKPATPPKSGPS